MNASEVYLMVLGPVLALAAGSVVWFSTREALRPGYEEKLRREIEADDRRAKERAAQRAGARA